MRKFFMLFIGVISLAACNRSPEYYFKRANISVSRGKEMQAIQDYNKAILLKRNFPEALTARGMIYEHMGDKQKAEQDYKHAINSSKEYIPAYNNLAALLMDQGNFREAADYLDEALKVNRDYPYAILNRGLCNYKLGRFKAAKADLTRALKMNPKFDMAYYHRALISKHEGNIKAAMEDLVKAIDNNPSAVLAWHELGKMLYSQKEYANAAQNFKKADDLAGNDMKAETSFWLALSTYQIGYYEQALESALLADELKPGSYKTNGLIGDIYAKTGDINNAGDYYKKAGELAGNKAGFYRARLAAIGR